MRAEKIITLQRTLMGGPFAISVVPPGGIADRDVLLQVRRAIELAFAEVRRIEDLLTDFRESPVTRLNDSAGGPAVEVPEELFYLVDYGLGVSRDSEGAFDLTYAPVGHLWRKAFLDGMPPAPEELRKAHSRVGHQGVRLFPTRRQIALSRPGMRVGMGGIGKGYAVDAVFRLLTNLGYSDFCINGAGDVRVSASHSAPRRWRVGIKNPFAPSDSAAGRLEIASGASATS